MIQLTLPGTVERRGGKRKGAGRKPKGDRAGTPHAKRAKVSRHVPLMVTFRFREGLPNLRCRRVLIAWEAVLEVLRERIDFHVIHYALLSNHVHLLVECDDVGALSRGMNSLLTRFTRAFNRLYHLKGRVLVDRFHDVHLKSPRQARNNLAYVLKNARKHGLNDVERMLDPYSSASIFPGWTSLAQHEMHPFDVQDVLSAPRTWLLREGWKEHGLLCPLETPGIRRR